MTHIVQRFMKPPVFEGDETKTDQASLLAPILLSLMGVLVAAGIVGLLIVPEKTGTLLVVIETLAILLSAWFVMQRGRVRLASGLFVTGLWVDVAVLVLLAGGSTSVDNVYFVALTVIAGLLLGRRSGIIVAIMSSLTGLGMVILERTGSLPPRIFPVPATSAWLMLTFALIMTAATLNLVLRRLDEALALSRAEIKERQQIQEALRESEQRFRTIFDSVNDAIFVQDLTTTGILNVNQRMCEMYGYTREEICRMGVIALSEGHSPYARLEGLNWMRLAADEPQLFEWRAKDNTGRLFWVEVNMRRAEIDGQDRLLVSVRDIDERKQAEQIRLAMSRISETAQTAQNLEQFFRQIHAIVGELMPAQNFYIALYDPANDLFTVPYQVDEFDAPWPPFKPDRGLTTYVWRTGKPLLASPEVRNQLVESGQLEMIGTSFIDWLGVPLKTNLGVIGVMAVRTYNRTARLDQAALKILEFVSAQVAMTVERKQTEERERIMIQGLHAIVEAADELISCASLDLFYRRAVELTRERLGVQRCAIFLLDEAHEHMRGTYGTDMERRTTDEHGAIWQAQYQPEIYHRGDEPWFLLKTEHAYWEHQQKQHVGTGWVVHTPIRIADEMIGVLVNDNAITQVAFNHATQELVAIYCSLLGNIIKRMRAEEEHTQLIGELEAKNAELERFTYTVSHDLKSPLITIQGFLGLIEQDAASGNFVRLKSDMARIDGATDKMQSLLKDLLELSRIGRLMNPSQSIPFEAIVQEALELVRGQLNTLGARIEVAPHLPAVYGDRLRLVEVVQNLLDNAIKFMGDQKAPLIRIGVRGPDDTGKPVFFVQDNGPGIAPEHHERIFGLFNKLDAHTEGTGIGLALVKRIVEIHNGRIWVESIGRGQGSTFCFTLSADKPASREI